jgi:hypothetical protein
MKRIHINEEEEEDDQTTLRIVSINAGGTLLCTSMATLRDNYPESVIAAMFSERQLTTLKRDDSGTYFIDTDGSLFAHILQYMRRGISFDLVPPGVLKEVWFIEVDYWGLRQHAEEEKKNKKMQSFEELVMTKMTEAERRTEETLCLLFTLTEQNDRIEQGVKSIRFYIPKDVYFTEWKQEMCNYLTEAKNLFFSRYSGHNNRHFSINNISYCSRAQSKLVDYQFNGVHYDTMNHPTLEVWFVMRYQKSV